MIQGVSFDLFETLVTESHASIQRASSLASRLGLNDDAYRRHWRSRRPDVVLGRSTFRETLAQIARTLGTPPDERILDDILSERVRQKAAVLCDVQSDVLATMEALRARGLRLALVTNSFREDVAAWDSSPLHPFFDVALFSCVAGLAKPDPQVYLLACRELALRPPHVLFIGDGGDDELGGARRAGLLARQAIWFSGTRRRPTVAADDPGLGHASDVVSVATPSMKA